ncbi:MAG: phosphate ABC transporter substrate-binding protein [Proteobacteria bacterium]|nr:phosphate ABC transporter substrate-binding protein [Pseudomonadota bacterium]
MHTFRNCICLIVLCLGPAVFGIDQLKGKLVITGSSTIAPLALELGKRFEKMHPGVRVDVQSGGSSRGVSDARQGLADIGLVSRALKPEEKDLIGQALAMDGIAVIVHKINPIQKLSKEQLIQIYTGKITDWKLVGGLEGPIVVVNKAAGRSTLELFAKFLNVKDSEIKAQIVIGDNEQGIKTVLGNPQAIAYVSIGTAEYNASQGAALKLLPLEGVAATVDNVKNGSYPLARQLNFVLKSPAQGLAKEFISFSLSAAAVDLVKEQYFVPLETKR